ncbi:MAG: hypothetical protein HY978_05075 [Candidatus Liptonbacteria bacterium]|nr:hypothetical protein [Candidatus Liptonbacteria bacterium]
MDPRVKPGDDIGAVFFTSRGSATLAFSLRRRVEVVPCGDRGLAILGGHVPAEEIEKATGEKCRVAFLETSTRGCRGDSWVRAAIAALGG